EQGEELLCFRLRPLTNDEGQLKETRRDIRFEHGAVVGDDRHAAVLLPQREGLAFLDADLQLAGIELEHRGVRDPRIGLEALARLIDVEKEQRSGAADAGGGEPLLAADVMIAGERDRDDAEAGCTGDAVARTFDAGDYARNVIAPDGTIGEARDSDDGGGGDAYAARPLAVEERRPALDDACEAGPRAPRPALAGGGRPRGCLISEAQAPSRGSFQRLSETSSIIHCTSSSNVMPACAASSGTSDVSVMPGCVLTSRQTSPPVPSMRSS